MSVVVADKGGGRTLITKGALKEMLSVSAYCEQGGRRLRLSDERRREISQIASRYGADGMRVLGLAKKDCGGSTDRLGVASESGMTFLGFLAFLDPPKESSAAAIKELAALGVNVKVLTGDSGNVAAFVCRHVGISVGKVVLGSDVDAMTDDRLSAEVETCRVFASLSPAQKVRIVERLRANGHVVGFLGDGINDAPSMRAADVSISVDTAVDVAKEAAGIILLEKSLMVAAEGVILGRQTYANIIKYIKMTVSSNFGNMLSVLVASAFLPFLPMLPVQILFLNLIYDISSTSIPWDNVDKDYIARPRNWDALSIGKFMLYFGPISSIFDIAMFGVLFWIISPQMIGGAYSALSSGGQAAFAASFQSGWFVFSLWTQSLIIHVLRTRHAPFIESNSSAAVMIATLGAVVIGTLITEAGWFAGLGFVSMPMAFFLAVALGCVLYMLLAAWVKHRFVEKYGELL